MKVLITGANGQLGWELQQTLPQGFHLTAFGHTEFDITEASEVEHAILENKPDLIINTAAYTSVDKAEEEKNEAFKVNSQGVANIAKAAVDSKSRFIHISTDFVFDGLKS